MSKINWDKDVLPHVRECLEQFKRQGVKPTLRTVFYWLVSRNVIPNTKQSYKQLSKAMVRWRKRKIFSWDILVDKVRMSYGEYHTMHNVREAVLEDYEESLREVIESLDVDGILNKLLPPLPYLYVEKWADQRYLVELWVEKEALAETLYRWTAQWRIRVRVNRGYSSWTFIHENVKELRWLLNDYERIVILYCGDWDPSGTDIDRFLREALQFFGIPRDRVELRRVAVTPEQIRRYNLPPRPEDSDTIEKLARDPRSKRFFEREDFFKLSLEERKRVILESGKYVVELDALVAFVPQEFKRLLNDEIAKYWDENVYKKLQAKKKELEAKAHELREKYKELLKKRLVELLS